MKARWSFLLFSTMLAILTSACGPSETVDNGAAEAAAIRRLDEQWSATAARNDIDGTVAFYADDAVLLPPNAPIATSQHSIRQSWAALLGPNTAVSWKVFKAEVAKSGELGYLYGTYELNIKNEKGGASVHDTGKLVEIWKRQTDGKWKCIVDIYNSDLAVPAASEKSR